MSGTRGGLGRIVAMGIALALALLLLAAREARAGKYAVAQCGWHVGADADWADTTGGAKFRPDAYCATPPGADPFDGAHLKSFTREGQRDRLRHPLRPLALGGAAGDRHHPGQRHLVARAARRDRAADRRRHLERRLRPLRRRRATDVDAARLRRRLLARDARARGPPALRASREQVVQPRTRTPGRRCGR